MTAVSGRAVGPVAVTNAATEACCPASVKKTNGYRRPDRQIEKITQRLFTNAIRYPTSPQ